VTSTEYPAPANLEPFITRVGGVWTGRAYPTAEAAHAAEPDAVVQADNYVCGQRPGDTPRHTEPIPREATTSAWTPDPGPDPHLR